MNTDTDYAIATGEYIEEWLSDHGMTQTEAAKRLRVSRKHLNRVIAGAPVTPDFATKLEIVTGVKSSRWLQLEAQYQSDASRLSAEARLADRLDIVDRATSLASALRKDEIITETRRNPGRLVMQLMAFFRIADPDDLISHFDSPLAAFRQTHAHKIDGAAVAGWLRMGEIESLERRETAPSFDPKKLEAAIPDLRSISLLPASDIPSALTTSLLELGVVTVFVPPINGCRAYGATRWFGDTPVMQLSLRRRDDGQLWFTVFHELGHMLMHPKLEFVEGIGEEDREEHQADEYARSTLIPDHFEPQLASARSLNDAMAIAKSAGVSPGVVVGRLHRDKIWPYENGRRLYKSWAFTSTRGSED